MCTNKYMIRFIVVFVTLRNEASRVSLGSGSFPTVRMTNDSKYLRLLNTIATRFSIMKVWLNQAEEDGLVKTQDFS